MTDLLLKERVEVCQRFAAAASQVAIWQDVLKHVDPDARPMAQQLLDEARAELEQLGNRILELDRIAKAEPVCSDVAN